MKLLILGAAGKLGQRLVESAVDRGHDVTAAVRDLQHVAYLGAERYARSVRAVQIDVLDSIALRDVMSGQGAIISAAGNVADGQRFIDLFDHVVTAAEDAVGGEKKVWMLAGAAVLDIPHTQQKGISLPFVPAFYRPHLANLQRIERSCLDWSLMCPGPMVADDRLPRGADVRLTVDALPFTVGSWVRFAPPIALSLVMKRQMPAITIRYASVADAIIDHLDTGGRFRRKRVGIARNSA